VVYKKKGVFMATAKRVGKKVTKKLISKTKRRMPTPKTRKLSVKKRHTAKTSAKTINKIVVKARVAKKKSVITKAVLAKKIKGYASDSVGLRFEQDVIAYYAKHGWKCTPRVKKFGREFDIVGTKSDGFDDEILVVECKKKKRVTPGDVLSFIAKADKYNRSASVEIQAVIAYTGELPRDAQQAAKSAKTRVRFKHFYS
jgi:hypothetical protein